MRRRAARGACPADGADVNDGRGLDGEVFPGRGDAALALLKTANDTYEVSVYVSCGGKERLVCAPSQINGTVCGERSVLRATKALDALLNAKVIECGLLKAPLYAGERSQCRILDWV